MMSYKGYTGSAEYDDHDGVFHGRVLGIRAIVTFEGTSVEEIRAAFRESVKDYVAWCKEEGREPEKPFSGRFVLRVPSELHRRATEAAASQGKSLNTLVAEVLSRTV